MHRLDFARILSAILVTGGIALAVPANAADLTYGSWARAGEHINAVSLTNAFNAIESKTNGRIRWKMVAGGQLGDGKSSYQGVQQGVMQGGLGVATFVPNLTPSTFALFSTLLEGDDVIAANAAGSEVYLLHCPSCLEEFKKINIVPLAPFTVSPFCIYCRDPIKSLTELKGKRVRALGGQAELVRMAGGAPIAATPPEALTLLQRGGLDCILGGVEWLKSFGYGDVAKHVVDYPLGMTGPAMAWMINRGTWSSFTADEKRLHLSQAAYVTAEQAIGGYTIRKREIVKEMADKGVTFFQPDEHSSRQVMSAYKKDEAERIAASVAKFGAKDIRSLIELYERSFAKWKSLSKEVGLDIAKFTELLQREIYDKVDPAVF